MTEEIHDVLLVYEASNGEVAHMFCSPQEAELRHSKAGTGSSIFACKEMSVSMYYSISPDLQKRVAQAKESLRRQIRIRDAMNKNGIPDDPVLRASIVKVIKELGW